MGHCPSVNGSKEKSKTIAHVHCAITYARMPRLSYNMHHANGEIKSKAFVINSKLFARNARSYAYSAQVHFVLIAIDLYSDEKDVIGELPLLSISTYQVMFRCAALITHCDSCCCGAG